MVTKQQQLKWLALAWKSWHHSTSKLAMSKITIGHFVSMVDDSHQITYIEWQQEREKMSNKPWYKRDELPPVGIPVELWFGGAFAYNCEFIGMRGNRYVVWNLDADRPDTADYMNSQFRPVRSGREKAIDEMKSLCAYPGSWDSTYKTFAEALYNAGYRKVES